MNWKYEAIDKLKGYEAHKRALENIPLEIERLQEAFTGIRSSMTDSTPVSGGGSTREDTLLSNIVHREELQHALKQAKIWVREVEAGLAVLDDEERMVLQRFYISRAKGAVNRICEELGVEKSAVYDRRDKALRHFTVALYGITES